MVLDVKWKCRSDRQDKQGGNTPGIWGEHGSHFY